MSDPNPWHPMKDPVDIKTIGKLIEEGGEVVSAAARCLIQGIDECEPVTGKSNRLWLEEEVADAIANLELVKARFNLRSDFISERVATKMRYLLRWHAQA